MPKLPDEDQLNPTRAQLADPPPAVPTDDDPPGPELDGMDDPPVWDDGQDIVIGDD